MLKTGELNHLANIYIEYQYEDSYVIWLSIERTYDEKGETATHWIEGDYNYRLFVNYLSLEASEVEIAEERLEQFRSFITKNDR